MQNFKKYLIVITFLILASNQSLADGIAVVNIQQVYSESSEMNNMRLKLEKKYLPRQTVLKGKQSELELKVRDYEKNKLTLSQEQTKKFEKEIITLRREFQNYGKSLQLEVQEEQQGQMKVIENLIEKAAKKIAEKENFDLVLYQGVVYYKKEIDITEKVIKELNN